jgi:hypothetical protein
MEVFEMVLGHLWQSSAIDEPQRVNDLKLDLIIDLEGGIDTGAGDWQGYLFWPIEDHDELPNLVMLQAVGNLGMGLVNGNKKVLVHCAVGINRASLVSGVILFKLGIAKGQALIDYIRERRPGALCNEVFADYLVGLK